MLVIFLKLYSKGLHLGSKNRIRASLSCVQSSIEHEIRKFHVVVLHRRQRNVQKSVKKTVVLLLQTCCFFVILVAFVVA